MTWKKIATKTKTRKVNDDCSGNQVDGTKDVSFRRRNSSVSKENISMRRAWPFIMSYNEGEKKSE